MSSIHASLNHHDALLRKDKALPVPGVQGAFVTVPTVARAELETGSMMFYVVVQWTASKARAMQISANRQMTDSFMINGSLDNDSPTAVRPLAMSIRLRNSSVYTSQAGIVRVLSVPQQIEWEFDGTNPNFLSQACFDSLGATMTNHPSVKSYTAHDFSTTKRFITAPASQVGYKNYNTWSELNGWPDHNNAFLQSSAMAPMNVTVMQFSVTPVGSANTYDMVVHTQDAARFPVNTMLSFLAKEPVPAAPAAFDAGVQNVQAASGSAMDTIVLPIVGSS